MLAWIVFAATAPSLLCLGSSALLAYKDKAQWVWFAALSIMGVINIAAAPQILYALNPLHALTFMLDNRMIAFIALKVAPTTPAAASYTPRNAGVSPPSRSPVPFKERSRTNSRYAGLWNARSSSSEAVRGSRTCTRRSRPRASYSRMKAARRSGPNG